MRGCRLAGFYFAFLGHLSSGLLPLGVASLAFQAVAAREIAAGDRLYASAAFAIVSLLSFFVLLDWSVAQVPHMRKPP